MSNTYTGVLRGFQVVTNMKPNIVPNKRTSNDLVDILLNLLKKFDLERLVAFTTTLSNHIAATDANVHNVVLMTLGEQIAEVLYEEWLTRGNSGSFAEFEELIYSVIWYADTDEELSGTSDSMIMTVKKFYRMLYLYHTGVVYAHPPILDAMVGGQFIEDEPYVVLKNTTDPITMFFQSNLDDVYLPEVMSDLINKEGLDIDGEVVMFDYLHAILEQTSWNDIAASEKLSLILENMYNEVLDLKPSDKEVGTVDIIEEGEVDPALVLEDAKYLHVDFDFGTWYLKPNITTTIEEPIYYLNLFNTMEIDWAGYDEFPSATESMVGEPAFTIFRHPDHPLVLYARFSVFNKINQIPIPINSSHSDIVVAYDQTSVRIGYMYDGEVTINTVVRAPFMLRGQRLTVLQSEEMMYYLRTVNNDEIEYLIS